MEAMNLDDAVPEMIEAENVSGIDNIIEDYIPFILKTASGIKKEYISRNDEEFSIGLLGFHEAMRRYDKSKGHFLPYAKVVISSRLYNFWKKENKQIHDPIDSVENTYQTLDTGFDENFLKDEINTLEKELMLFDLSFEKLVEHTPRHKDTRYRAMDIAKKISQTEDLIDLLYSKRRLPVTALAERLFISPKILKGSKHFIIAAVIIHHKKLNSLTEWIRK